MTKTFKISASKSEQDNYSDFSHLFFKYYSALCAYVTSIINDPFVSEDIIQNLFVKLWSDRKKITIQKDLEHYLFKAAKNKAIDYLKSEAKRKKEIGSLERLELPDEEDYLEQEKFLQKLEECINQLPERAREVIVLSRFEKLKQKEISEKLNISVKTIKNQIWKSLKYLKSCLKLKDAS